MKQNLLIGLISSGALLLTGCGGDEFNSKDTGSGRLSPSVALDAQVLSSVEESRAATDITGNDLAITLTSADGSISRKWNSIAEFPVDEDFKVGEYTLTASYGDNSEGFELPYYSGTATVYVKENAVTPVSVTATLANAMLSIDYTDAFKNYFHDYSTDVTTPGGKYIFYAAAENRPVYIKPGAVSLTVNVTKPNGVEAHLAPDGFTVEPRRHYHLTLDVNGGEVGDAAIVISFDDSLSMEDVIIDLSDDLQNAPAPVVTSEGITPGQTMSFVAGMAPETPVKMEIMARGGLASVMLTTRNRSLIEQGWPATLDLMNVSDQIKARLTGLGFKTIGLWKNPDQFAIVDFTDVLNNIEYIEGADNSVEFSLVVKDRYTKESDPVTINLNVEKLTLAISNPTKLYQCQQNFELDLDYNGIDPEGNITFEARNERNTWDKLTVESISAISRASSTYHVVLTVPAVDDDLTIHAKCRKTDSEELTVARQPLPIALSVNENNIFATHGIISLTALEEPIATVAPKTTLAVSTDGNNFSTYNTAIASDGTINLTALSPATTYYFKATADGITSKAISFTTETAAQLPNGNMESWSQGASASHWELVYPGADASTVWGTNNPLTTSQGSNYAYCRISGTISTTDSHSGKAALIRNVGWGSGNSATGSKGTSGACKYTEVGLLHLGASRTTRPSGYSADDNKSNSSSPGPVNTDDLDCGMAFASRPESISFWYKYSPKNSSDKANAYVWVKDASGNIIAENTINLGSKSGYEQITLPLTYGSGTPKGAKIYVRFMSSNSIDYVKRTDANYSGPGFANVSRGTFMGSQLYIDDIQLNY